MWIWLNSPDPCSSLAKSYGNDVVPTSGAAPENTKKNMGIKIGQQKPHATLKKTKDEAKK